MSMGSAAAVSRRAKSAGAARTSLLKSRQPARSAGAAQMPSGPESAGPASSPSPMSQAPSASWGVRPAPAGFTKMSVSTLGHSPATASTTSAMSPALVHTTALMSAPLRRYVRSCSFSMKVAGTATAPSFARASMVNQN